MTGIGILTPDRRAAADSCEGAYAEDLASVSAEGRTKERDAGVYSYAVRTSATYECVSYGEGGALHTTRQSVTAYGTAFGLRRDGEDTLLVTNDHVAEWPAVTDDDHPAGDVPSGCRRAEVTLAIVDDDRDNYRPDDIPLSLVAGDRPLDVAIVRAHRALGVVPWRLGSSASLAARDAVFVVGYPLGEFRATNVGKVTVASEHDGQGDWDHDDLVFDALVAPGNSGSPVLAVSCKTGEPELVGIFHARYVGAPALNTAITIDQLRDFLTTLVPPNRAPPAEPDAAARTRLASQLRDDPWPPLFDVGNLLASIRARPDGALVYMIFSLEFARDARPLLVLEDLPSEGAFGALGAVYARTTTGLRRYTPDDVARGELAQLLALVRRDAIAAFDQRADARNAPTSRAEADRLDRAATAVRRLLNAQQDVVLLVQDLAARADAHPDDDGPPVTLDTLGAR
jgi:serine protease Do